MGLYCYCCCTTSILWNVGQLPSSKSRWQSVDIRFYSLDISVVPCKHITVNVACNETEVSLFCIDGCRRFMAGGRALWLALWLRSTKLIYVGPGHYWTTVSWFNSRCRSTGHLFRYATNQPPKANSALHPSGVGKWVPASARKAKACMVNSVSGCTRGVQVKLWDPLRTRAIPERLRGVFTTRRYTNPRLPLPLPLSWSWPLFVCLFFNFIHKQLSNQWYKHSKLVAYIME